jgi:tetratricopeptide (TPR) repeat protein
MIISNKLDEALKEYQRVLQLNPKSVRAHNNLGVVFFKKKQYDKAIAEFNIALKLNPYFEESIVNLERVKKKKIVELLKPVLISFLGISFFSCFVILTTRQIKRQKYKSKETKSQLSPPEVVA